MIFVYDFCGTIYRCNTTLTFMKYLFIKEGLKYRAKYIFYLIRARVSGVGNDNKYLKIRVMTLNNMKINILKKRAEEFINELDSRYKNEEIFNKYITNKDASIIISNTLNFIVNAFAERYNKDNLLDNISSALEEKDDKVIGRYKLLLSEYGKANAMINKYGLKYLNDYIFYTDDLVADSDMCSKAAEVIHVK